MESECAALKWLETVDVPPPCLYKYALQNDPCNGVVVAYMLIDELPGKPLLYEGPSEEQYKKELAQSGRWNAFKAGVDDVPFYLKHMDDKGDHILVDAEYNVPGIIDWMFVRIVPAYEAFGPSLLTADMDAMYNGKAGGSSRDNMLAESLHGLD
ncbi:uncharacterized protein BDV17DRAFT_292138 [Aspergillus undulatus]|uniref:uncharacterized protein n=1 Tax=Aspergillus undulatus TaxID=1810928 RepID=UPI003CCD970C